MLPAGHLREQFLDVSYRPAVKFFEVTEAQVLPAVERNEPDKARAALRDSLLPLYETHRAAIEEVVNIADGSLKKEETAVAAMVSNRGLILVVLGATVLFAMILSAIFRSTRHPRSPPPPRNRAPTRNPWPRTSATPRAAWNRWPQPPNK
jgi:hypothetical protein